MDWLVNPLSYFGMTPFSSYPIGSVYLLGFFLGLGVSLEVAVNLYVAFFCIICGVASYQLMKYLFDNELTCLLGVLLYQLMPIIYTFTYNMATSRALVLALVPLLILYLLKWTNTGKNKYLLYSFIMIPFLMLLHRMSITYFVFLAVVIGLRLLYKLPFRKLIPIKSPRTFNRVVVISFFLSMVGLLLSSFVIFGFNSKNIVPDILLPPLTLGLPQDLLGFSLDYFLFYGPMLFLAFIGIWQILSQIWKTNTVFVYTNSNQFILILLLAPFVLFLTQPAYARHLLAPIVLCLAMYGLQLAKKSSTRLSVLILLTVPFATFFLLYDILWRDIGFYVMVSTVSLFGILIFGILLNNHQRLHKTIRVSERNHMRIRFVIVLSIILVMTLVNNDMRVSSEMDGILIPTFVTEEEVVIANYIKENRYHYSGQSVIISSHYYPEVRIAAYAETGCLADGHGTSILISGYLNGDEVLENSTLDVVGNFFQGVLYDYPLTTKHLWLQIMHGDYNDPVIYDLIFRLNIHYFIGLKGSDNALYSSGSPFQSEFRVTLSAPIVFETAHYVVYRLN